MKILTTFRVKSIIKDKLIKTYKNTEFTFHASMKDAIEDLKNAEVLITYGEDLNDEIIDSAQKLKWIMVLSAGIEKLPFEAIKRKGILVTNAKGIHKTPMAEYTISMMLQVARNTKKIIENEQHRNWDRSVKMVELAEKTITILGTGAIGSEIARLAKAFRMNVLGINRSGKLPEFFDEVFTLDKSVKAFENSDFIVSVLPSTSETQQLFTRDLFKLMKKQPIFINIGRGDVVEESVLLEMLQTGNISHAVLDVFEKEPLAESHPFWKLENVTVTPHISGLSSHYQPRGFEIFEYYLQQYISGNKQYKNIIDLDRGY
ncbi:D-2-hydroxyacid dehydrogenase [Bacillus sp. Marseille-P3661]|uniref:D-2-hydroxyacid dehydrogenase n=1 Tax=Bacillus sp. Marseille-P3661 TaxID=1936234 RepID=UPI000C857E50|nr:D-2-hydroxyacid dehydrogenase [Bacillus sp. Marseille-P3661]